MFIWTTRTILVFGKKVSRYGKTLPKKEFWGTIDFWDYCENEFIFWRYVLKSSPMLGSTPQGLLFLKRRHFSNFETCPFWRNCTLANIWSLRKPSGGFRRQIIEVRDSRTGYFIPVRYGLGLLPDGKIVGAPPSPPPPSASSGKWPNIRKCTLFPKWACLKFPEMSIYQK